MINNINNDDIKNIDDELLYWVTKIENPSYDEMDDEDKSYVLNRIRSLYIMRCRKKYTQGR